MLLRSKWLVGAGTLLLAMATTMATAGAQTPAPVSSGDGPSAPGGAADGPSAPGGAGAGRRRGGGQFYQPPGEPASRKLLSPIKAPPPGGPGGGGPIAGAAAAKIAPPSDPRDFEGAWSSVLEYNALVEYKDYKVDNLWHAPPYTAKGRRIFWNRVEQENAGTPVPDAGIACKPMGLARAMNAEFGYRALQSKDRLTWMTNEDHLVRRIRIGGRHPANLKPTYMGDSVAHWEGNTLVVDSTGFNDRTWLDFDGSPHSTKLHITERLRKIDNGSQLEDLMTFTDPVMYTRPWTARMVYAWAPITETSPEIICEENDVQLMDYKGKDVQ